MAKHASNLTRVLDAIRAGDEHRHEELFAIVYRELHAMAQLKMAQESPGHTLQPTALVHEAYLRLVDGNPRWEGRAHFFGAAAEAMRRILVDRARRVAAAKRGGGRVREVLDDGSSLTPPDEDEAVDLVVLDRCLSELEKRDPRKGEVVKLRFFAGLTMPQIASALEVTERTVHRDWVAARAWLHAQVTDDPSGGPADDG